MPELVNGRLFMRPGEYAKHKGVSATAISNAIARGKIFKNKYGMIDVEQSDSMYTPAQAGSFFGRRPQDLARAADARAQAEREDTSRSTEIKRREVSVDEVSVEDDDLGVPIDEDGAPPQRLSADTVNTINQLLGGKINAQTEDVYVKGRAAREMLKAESEYIKLEQLKGTLISVEDVKKQVFRICRHNRDAWMNWPEERAVDMAAELGVDPKALCDLLKLEVKRNLETIARMDFDDVTDPS